jgi:pyrroline-5-carboxylate reductase
MTYNPQRIAFIGAGNMANALITGLLNSGLPVSAVVAIDPSAEQRQAANSKFSIACFENINPASMAGVDVCVLATKPQQLSIAAAQLAHTCKQTGETPLFISIAAGIALRHLEALLGEQTRIVRTMPNTPALIGQGMTGMFANSLCTERDKAYAQQIMRACGQAIWMNVEQDLNAVTAISGSGPAYVFYFLEALQAAGQELGLTELQARDLAMATFTGASSLAAQSAEPLAVLRDRVTSKGGTTFAALEYMREKNVGESIRKAALAAAARAKELGEEFGR